MHIFCPNCGKHIDVSIKEIERLEGHYLCPQCLVDIDLEGFEQNTRDFDYQDYDNEETAQSQPAPSVKSVPEPASQGRCDSLLQALWRLPQARSELLPQVWQLCES